MKFKLKNNKNILIALVIIVLFAFVVFFISDGESTQNSFETAILDDSNVTIDSLESSSNKQTFNIFIENTTNESLSVYHTFRIESDGNIYKPELSIPKDFNINPDMSTKMRVDFKMPDSVLDEKDAKLIVSSLSSVNEQEILLNAQ